MVNFTANVNLQGKINYICYSLQCLFLFYKKVYKFVSGRIGTDYIFIDKWFYSEGHHAACGSLNFTCLITLSFIYRVTLERVGKEWIKIIQRKKYHECIYSKAVFQYM